MGHFRHTKYIILFLLLPFLIWALLGRGRSGDFDLAHSFIGPSFQANVLKIFSNNLQADTKEAMHIELKNVGRVLWPTSEIKEAIEKKQYALGAVSLADLSSESPVFSVGCLPFLATTYQQSRILWRVTRYHVIKHLKKQKLLYLFSIPSAPHSIFSPKKLIQTSDLEGLYLRAYSTKMKEFLELLGAKPLSMREGESHDALQKKRVGGFFGGKNAAYQADIRDFAPYYYGLACAIPKHIVVIHEDVFAALSVENQQKLLMQAQTMESIAWKMSEADDHRREAFFKREEIPDWLKDRAEKAAEEMLREWLHISGKQGQEILRHYRAHLDQQMVAVPKLLNLPSIKIV